MKIQLQRSAAWLFAVSLLFLLPQNISAQDCQKTISYEIKTTLRHALPEMVSHEDLNIIDYIKAKPEDRRELVEQCINSFGQLSTTRTRLDSLSDADKQRQPVWQSTVDGQGVKLWGYDGDEIPIRETSADANIWDTVPAPSWQLNAHEIEAFGFTPPFEAVTPALLNTLLSNGVNASINGEQLIIQYADQEIIYDSGYPYTVHKFYKDGVLQRSITKTFTILDSNNIIPEREIEKTYINLSTGDLMQRTITKFFVSYTVIADGEVIIEHRTNDDNIASPHHDNNYTLARYTTPRTYSALQITPNPASTQINIQLPRGQQIEHSSAEVNIFNASGQLMYQRETSNHHLQINTQDLSRGLYFLQCRRYGQTYTARFVIQ